MNRWMETMRRGRGGRVVMVTVLGVLLTACGGGDAEDEPAVTTQPGSARPTVEGTVAGSTAGGPSTPSVNGQDTPPANIDLSSPSEIGTPVETQVVRMVEAGTPVGGELATVVSMASPADLGAPGAPGSPTATPATTSGQEPEEAGPAATDVAGIGDGTTGAKVPADEAPESDATPAPVGSAPAAGAQGTPAASSGTPVADGEPLRVEGCEVEDVPRFFGVVTSYRALVDVNFRAGPGADCDVIGNGPLGEFSPVEIIGGPVIREGEGEIEWVQVQVGDDAGWVALEYLEPAR